MFRKIGLFCMRKKTLLYFMKTPIHIAIAGLLLALYCCIPPNKGNTAKTVQLKEGEWKAVMQLPGASLPFQFTVSSNDSGYVFTVKNNTEEISITSVKLQGDSIQLSVPVFQSTLSGTIQSDTLITGLWHNYAKGNDYVIPFEATYGAGNRFPVSSGSQLYDFSGKWEVSFSKDSSYACKAIGLFEQTGNKVSGTFITETGDYRFLDGNVEGDSLFLSCFDGSHAFLFKAHQRNNKISGQFWSGKHWQESWEAVRNDSFALTHPDSLTFLMPGYEGLAFAFPNLDSTVISLSDSIYNDKIVIVQIMGSWCPNCADETTFLNELYRDYHDSGLEIIALAYEKSAEFSQAAKAVEKMKRDLGAPYEFLIAGKASKSEAQKTLPMLNHIMSYPTCIFIDRNKKIRKIHTGFYGPGTGEFYSANSKEMRDFTAGLLKEPAI